MVRVKPGIFSHSVLCKGSHAKYFYFHERCVVVHMLIWLLVQFQLETQIPFEESLLE